MLRIISLLLLVTPVWSNLNLVATINMGGVTGTITFSQDSAGGADTTITLALNQPAAGVYTLSLHEYRVKNSLADRCGTESIGAQKKVIGSAEVTSGSGSLSVQGMSLSGPNSIEGRSILFIGDQTRACATIEADGAYITAFAQLPAALGGTVMFRQQEASADSDTMIYTDLQFVGTTTPSSPLKWMIYDGTVKMDTMTTTDVAGRCGSNIGSLYNPTASTTCSPNNQDDCAIGSLSTKHGNIPVSSTLSSRGFFIDESLPLSGAKSIIGKTLVFMNGNTAFACANIVQYLSMSAEAKFSQKDVSGKMTFSQKSPLDTAMIGVDLSYPANSIYKYEITEFPTQQKMTSSETVCDMDHIGNLFSPFVISTAPQQQTTPDTYAVGDLSGKFGPIDGATSFNKTYTDSNLQLFGRHSVVGRSVVIFDQQTGRYVCSTIRSTHELTTAVAKFTYPVIGYIILQQPKDVWHADTQIYVSLDYGTTMTATTGHKWHVHENPTGNDTMTDEGICQSAGGHYNPYGVDLAGNYASRCGPDVPLRCEVGDLSKKHSLVDIRKTTGNHKKQYFFTDTQLPLHGPLKVIGKSITIHKANSAAPRLACTNIVEQKTRELKVDSWSAASGKTAPSGSITFKEHCTDIWACDTNIKVELSNLADVKGYHVHVAPTTSDITAADKCQADDVRGHYNPLGGPATGPDSGTNDRYEVGDLSGKFGGLTSGSFSAEMMDMNLPLLSPLSIADRSIVIHDKGGPREACGNIKDTKGTMVKAIASFTGDYQGYVILSQSVYDDGCMSPTSVLVDLKNKDGTATQNHNWHVHEERVATPGDCASAAGHYNPFKVNLVEGYGECGKTNPLRCEMGDQSKKLGQYDIGSKKALYTDVNLYVEGKISAAKRSIVFHAAGGEAPRIACANLVPYQSTTDYEYSFPNVDTSGSFSLASTKQLEETIATAIVQNKRDILAIPTNVGSLCTTVTLYFLGPQKQDIRNLFEDYVKSGNTNNLGIFKNSNDCTSSAGFAQLSSVMMLMSVLLAIFGRQH